MRESTRAYALLMACRAFREWLDLPEGECVRQVQLALRSADDARLLMQAKALVSVRVLRDYVGPDADAATPDFVALYARQQEGTANAVELRYLQHSTRVLGIGQFIAQSYPEVALAATASDPRVAELMELLPALEAAVRACDVGRATPARVKALSHAIDTFVAGATAWTAPIPPDHAWWVGMARYALGRAALEIGEASVARIAFADGAQSFDAAGATAHADDMRRRVSAIDTGARADFDAVADSSLQVLLQSVDALDEAKSLAALGTASLHAGDTFEYGRLLTQVATLLERAGYPDPERELEPAVFGWFEAAVQVVPADKLLAHLNDVGVLWARVMSARALDPHRYGTPPDPQPLAIVESRPREIAARLADLGDMTASEWERVDAELAPWFGATWAMPADTHDLIAPEDDTTAALQQSATLDTALYALRLATNAEASDPSHADALVSESERLLADAVAHGFRVHVVQAHLAQAYLLLALSRLDAASVAVSNALAVLIPNRAPSDAPPSMHTLVHASERSLYLDAQLYLTRIHSARQDHAALLASSLPVIAELELQRARVNSPYQRAAFLGAGVELYERATASAFHLGRFELVLQLSEALKANGAWRMARSALDEHMRVPRSAAAASIITHEAGSALVNAREDFDALDAQYRAVNITLAQRPEGAGVELQERRSRLAVTRAIARQRLFELADASERIGGEPTVATPAATQAVTPAATPDPLSLRLAQLQQALAPDEAALSWCGVGEHELVLCCVSATDFHVLPISLNAAQQAALMQWVHLMTTLGEPERDEPERDEPEHGASEPDQPAPDDGETYARRLSVLDGLVDTLAPLLLPAQARRFITGKRRLLLSPHRLLHLFPFHAMRWPEHGTQSADTDWLIGTFAVRYAPNLISLCAPWSGCTDGGVLAVGVSDFENEELPRLANAGLEASEVAKVHGEQGMLAANITRAQFMATSFERYRCVHLATHGSSVLAGRAIDDPFASGVAFADGMLDGWQISSLDLRAELVVVAACFSGQRAIGGRGLVRLPGDDVLGLQSMLFEAGVGTVLGALWPADDDSTRVILVEFHRGYANGLAPDLALQRAMVRFLANPFRPATRYHWAPFFLTSLAHPHWSAPA